MNRIVINSKDKILIIAPHPDDESIGLGGLLAIYGNQCDIWVMTDGSNCKMKNDKAEIVKIRSGEFISAMSFCGVRNYQFWGIEDRCLSQYLDVLHDADIEQYTKIFVPSNNETHVDHISAYYAVMNMLIHQKITDKEIYCYEITSPLHQFNCALDISDVIERKRQCIELYRSQIDIFDYSQAASSLNCFRACMMGLFNSYVEVYNMVDLNSYHCKEDRYRIEIEKYAKTTHLLQKWIRAEVSRSTIEKYLKEKEITTVSIYGYGLLGQLLYEILDNTSIHIVCVIDRKFINENEKFISPNQEIPKSDAVILTVLFEHNTIVKKLYENEHKNVILLEEMIDNIEKVIYEKNEI